MAISESVANTAVLKEYVSGVIGATEANLTTDIVPATGGQTIRRTRVSLNLSKTTFSSQEINPTRQVSDYRHGTRKVEGSIAGELSAQTYFPYIVAAHRDVTPSGAFTALTQTTYTSVAADAAAGTLTLGAGDPVTTGLLRVGDAITLSGLTAGNVPNNGLYVITGFGGVTNKTISVAPSPAVTMTAQTTFSIARTGRSTIVPSSGHVQRKFAIEVVDSQLDFSRLFTECRFAGYSISCPSEGMASISLDVTGRNQSLLTGASSPFFSSPLAPTTTGIAAAANGVLRLNGANVGVVTSMDVAYKMDVTAPSVVGSGIVPDILLGTSMVTGTISAFVQDSSILGLFANETPFEVIVTLPTSDGNVVAVYLPKVKLTGATIDLADGAQTISAPFQALLNSDTTLGKVATTIRVTDSAAP